MTLLNGLLALGALAFTVPLAIHLLFRSRFTTVDWGAMHLLDSVVRINRRRMQLVNWLLLLLRCAIPILLAFCLARPVLTGFQTLPGDAPQSLVLAVDDSLSMSVRDETGNTRLERLQQDLVAMVGELSRRDEVILIRSGRVDEPAASMGSQDALGQLRGLSATSGPVSIDRLLRAAVDAAADAANPQRRIVLASDFAADNLDDTSLAGLSQLAKTLEAQAPQPIVSFLNYGSGSEALPNVSVDSIVIDAPAVIAGRTVSFEARIRNASDRVAQDVRLVWSVDGQALPARSITIEPRSTTTNRLTHRVDQPGVHELTVAVEQTDSLAADNRRSIAVDATSEIDVLLVDGDPSRQPLQGETDFLAIALSPFAFGGEDQPDAVRTRVVTQREFGQQFAASQPDILILANVESLARQSEALVAQFVVGGGALVVFDGDQVSADSYNAGWTYEQGKLTFPATMRSLIGDPNPDAAEPMSIGELNPQYTPWKLLHTAEDQPFGDVQLYAYRKLELPAEVTPSSGETPPIAPTITLLESARGDPLVVTAQRGRGTVVQFAIPCDTGWSSLPLRRVYLPMVQQLMLDLAGQRKQTTYAVGETLAVPLAEFGRIDEELANESVELEYTVTTPSLLDERLTPNKEASPALLFDNTDLRGIYRFRRQLSPPGAPQIADATIRVVQVPPEESVLRDVEPRRLASAADTIGARVYGDYESLASDDRVRRFGREIWRWLLIALLIGMVGELMLQQYSIRHVIRGGVS